LIIFLFSSLIFSCEREKESLTSPKNQENEVYKKILAAGFKKENIVEYKDYYLVEGDIVFRKNKVKNDSPIKKQAWTGGSLVSLSNIKVYLNSSSFTSLDQNGDLSRALQNAVNAYNSLNTSLHFEVADYPGDAHIRIDNSCGYVQYCGEADFPDSGLPGYQINLCEYIINQLNAISESQLTFLLVHEMGHTIGLRHTNWADYGESGAVNIQGTPTSDQYSVMNYGTCGWSWDQYPFTSDDIQALNTLYPGASLTFSPNYFDIAASSWTSVVSISSNSDWTLESDQPWLTFNGQSGNGNDDFNITASENTLGYSRTGHITASFGYGQSTILTVNQAPYPALAVNKNTISFNSSPSSDTFSISSNCNWTISSN
jgi:hypothetical protein